MAERKYDDDDFALATAGPELRRQYPVTKRTVVDFLKGRSFRNAFGQLMGGSVEFEQGFVFGMDPDKKIKVVWGTNVSHASVQIDMTPIRKRKLLLLGHLHVHPISNYLGAYADYVPSLADLTNMNTENAVFRDDVREYRIGLFQAMIVRSSTPVAWAWAPAPLTGVQLKRLYGDWLHSLSGRDHIYGDDFITRPITWREIDDLHSDLKNHGVRIDKRNLDKKDLAGSFAQFIQDMNFQFGFL